MDWLTNLIWHDGKLFGVDWSVWKVIGWLGNAGFLHALFCSMVCHRKEKTRRRADGVLVVEPGGFPLVADLFAASAGFRVYLCLHLHMDSLYPKSHHSPAPQGSAHGLFRLREELSAAIQFLSELRREIASSYFLAAGLAATGLVNGIPYFFRMGWKSGCVCP